MMKVLMLLMSVLVLIPALAKKEEVEKKSIETTKERARDMFRAPSGDKAGKIPDKYQPIDHKIKTESEIKQETQTKDN